MPIKTKTKQNLNKLPQTKWNFMFKIKINKQMKEKKIQ